jgi:RNase P subunit RPR2
LWDSERWKFLVREATAGKCLRSRVILSLIKKGNRTYCRNSSRPLLAGFKLFERCLLCLGCGEIETFTLSDIPSAQSRVGSAC